MAPPRIIKLKPHVNAMVGMIAAHASAAQSDRAIKTVNIHISDAYLVANFKHGEDVYMTHSFSLGRSDVIKKLEALDAEILNLMRNPR